MTTAAHIQSAAKCTIAMFMEVAFDHNLKALGEGADEDLLVAWENIQGEYADLAGINTSQLTPLLQQYYMLDTRIKAISLLINIQEQCIKYFGMPSVKAFPYFQRFSYRLTWNPDTDTKEGFLAKLERIKTQEKRFEVQREEVSMKMDQLAEKELQDSGPISNDVGNSRRSFIMMLNALKKYGYDLPKEVTTMEELGLMVKAYNDHLIHLQKENANGSAKRN